MENRDFEVIMHGHACVEIVYETTRLIVDPWFGIPFHFNCMVADPEIRTPTKDYLSAVSAIHISHVHRDHLCPNSLSLFSKTTPIIIGQYPDQRFYQQIRSLGFSDIRISTAEGLQINNLKLYNYPLTPFDGSFDSLFILESLAGKIMLTNDCILNESEYQKIAQRHKNVDIGILGYAYVSPYPHCYRSEDSEPKKEQDKRKKQMLLNIELLNSIFNFKKIIPYANGIRIRHSNFNFHENAFDYLPQLFESPQIKDKLCRLDPNQKYLIGQNTIRSAQIPFAEIPEKSAPPIKNDDVFLDSELYVNFFTHYLDRHTFKKAVSNIFIQVFSSNHSKFFNYLNGKTITVDTKNNNYDLVLKLPVAKLNQVVLQKATMASIYYSFDFEAKYKVWPDDPRDRIHWWFT